MGALNNVGGLTLNSEARKSSQKTSSCPFLHLFFLKSWHSISLLNFLNKHKSVNAGPTSPEVTSHSAHCLEVERACRTAIIADVCVCTCVCVSVRERWREGGKSRGVVVVDYHRLKGTALGLQHKGKTQDS